MEEGIGQAAIERLQAAKEQRELLLDKYASMVYQVLASNEQVIQTKVRPLLDRLLVEYEERTS